MSAFLKALSFTNILNLGFFGIAATESTSEVFKSIFFAVGALLSIAAGYFIGSLNPAIYFSKKLFGGDVRLEGSGNAGSTNMLRTYGKKAGAMTAGCDFAKGVVSAIIGYILFGYNGAAIAGLFAVVGHIAPIYYGFKGGKGVMVAASVLLMLDPIVFLVCIAIFAAIIFLTKIVSFASITTALVYPFIFTRLGNHLGIPAITTIISGALIIIMHKENMKRIYHGEEKKITIGKPKVKDTEETTEDDTPVDGEIDETEKKPSQKKSEKNRKKANKAKTNKGKGNK